jgi:hypothetical protein
MKKVCGVIVDFKPISTCLASFRARCRAATRMTDPLVLR